MIESLSDPGVTTKETLLLFNTLPNDLERAIGPAQPYGIVAGSVRRWRRGGAGGASDLVKVKGRGSGLKPQTHLSHTGPEIPSPLVQ